MPKMNAQASNQFVVIAWRTNTIVRAPFEPASALTTCARTTKKDDAAKLGTHDPLQERFVGAQAARAHEQSHVECRGSGCLYIRGRRNRGHLAKAGTAQHQSHRLEGSQRFTHHEDTSLACHW
jgi:hypothetical protein